MQNQTQLVRSAINLFIVIAFSVALFQQILNLNTQSTVPSQTITTPQGETVPLQPTGPIIQGIKIHATDRYTQPVKELLAQNKMNIQITGYTFQGNQYWITMIFNWGHMLIIYFLLNKYKTETDDQKKKKIMIGGAIAVLAWFYVSAQLKPQAIAIEVQGSKVYDRDYFSETQVIEALQQHEFTNDDLNEAAGRPIATQKVDAWEQQQQQQKQRRINQNRATQQQQQQQALEAEEIF